MTQEEGRPPAGTAMMSSPLAPAKHTKPAPGWCLLGHGVGVPWHLEHSSALGRMVRVCGLCSPGGAS